MFGEVSSVCLTVCGPDSVHGPLGPPLDLVPFYLCFIFACIFILATNQLKEAFNELIEFFSEISKTLGSLGPSQSAKCLGSGIYEEDPTHCKVVKASFGKKKVRV